MHASKWGGGYAHAKTLLGQGAAATDSVYKPIDVPSCDSMLLAQRVPIFVVDVVRRKLTIVGSDEAKHVQINRYAHDREVVGIHNLRLR